MNIFKLSIKNIFNKPLSSTISLALLILGVGIISLLLQLNSLIKNQMNNNLKGIDMVVGAKGSPLQLILSSVYHVDSPTGNISYKEADEISKNKMVGSSIKLLYGDNYKGFRIVGAEKKYIELHGAVFKKGNEWNKPFEVVVGSKVSKELKNVTFITQNKDISSFNYLPRLEDNIHYNYFGMKKIGILFSNNFNKFNNNYKQ